jgi:pimeloyl-ACP methyl ester carboxylesterase
MNISIKNDSDWKNYVYKKYRELLKIDKIEAQIFIATMFESITPFTACFKKIKHIPRQSFGITRWESLKIPTADGLQLDAWFFPNSRAKGLLIVLHGGGFNMADSLGRSLYLLAHQYQLLLYNARFWNFAENPADYIGFVGNDLADIQHVINYLQTRGDIEPGKIGLLGYSYGGLKCLLFAPGSLDIKVVISDSAPLRLFGFNHGPTHDLEFIRKVKARLHERYRFDIYSEKYDVPGQVQEIAPKPLLLLQGINDPIIHPDITKNIFSIAQEPKQMHIFHNSGHCDAMFTPDKEEYIQVVTTFLNTYL